MSTSHGEVYVSPAGHDGGSGSLADPFATLDRALQAARDRRGTEVVLRGGRHELRRPLVLGPADSGLVLRAYADERPVLDGGVRLRDIRPVRVGERDAWAVDTGGLAPRSMFVDGARRPRSRFPEGDDEYLWIEEVPGLDLALQWNDDQLIFRSSDSFRARAGDLPRFQNVTDVEAVALHYWIEERMPLLDVDEGTGLVRCARRSVLALRDDLEDRPARYYVENALEGLTEAGRWCLDRPNGRLLYLPLPGEEPSLTEIVVPVLEELLHVAGRPDDGELVAEVRLEGIGLEHADWSHADYEGRLFADADVPGPREVPLAGSPQAACAVPGALRLEGARDCALERCRVRHVGRYAVEVGDGCRDVLIRSCELEDLGAGGVRIGGANREGPQRRETTGVEVSESRIEEGGRVFPSAVGILITHASGCRVADNRIRDLFYSGISCGWVWGYGDSITRDVVIEGNHISELGHGVLSDLGGIYTLGVQPGTVIRGNLIHDVRRRNYGGWGIYLDEGSSHILVEANVVFDVESQPFRQHYGRENLVRGNVLAFGGEGQVGLPRPEPHVGFTFERNVVVTDGPPVFVSWWSTPGETRIVSDLNLLWRSGGGELVAVGHGERRSDGLRPATAGGLDALQALGHDRHSVVANPRFRDVAGRDLRLEDGSPAFDLGFGEAAAVSALPRRP